MTQPISELMQRHVVHVDAADTVAEVRRLFTRRAIGWAPVLDRDGDVIGVISLTDLLPFETDLHDAERVQAWQLCTDRPISVAHHTPATEVARLMTELGVHHVVVTDEQGLAGVVSSLDFARAFFRQWGP